MKILSFQAERFGWKAFSQTLEDADPASEGMVSEAAVIWLHIEPKDADNRSRSLKYSLKHIKWLANKRSLRTVVLHSFAHLGGETADAEFARQFIDDLADRLSGKYDVQRTPFGWFCSWDLAIFGDSMAKVFKSF